MLNLYLGFIALIAEKNIPAPANSPASGFDITSATIISVVSIIVSTFISFLILRTNKKKDLDDQLDGILKIAIQYPYLESDQFTNSWTSSFDRNDERYLRYDIYCTLLFNYLARVAETYKYDQGKIENYIAIKDWVRLHKKYWDDPTSTYENVDTYDKPFVTLVKNYLK